MNPPSSMRALRFEAVGQLVEARLPVPEPQPDEVLIRTAVTTICTSDLNDLAHNPFGIQLPRVLGHEGAGRIVRRGSAVRNVDLGDCVAAHPVIPCGQCEPCRRGLGHLCSDMGHLGLDRDGTFAEFFAIRADRVRRLPLGVDFSFASLLEPLAVCLEAVQRGRISRGDSVLVAGDGPFGLLIARLALRLGAAPVIVVGRHEFRLAQVPEAVAVNERTTPNVQEAIRRAAGRSGVDVAVVAAGSASALEMSLANLRARGRAVVFSAVRGTPSIDWFRLHTQELEILGACNDQNQIDAAISLLGDPALRLSSLVTHQVPFSEWSRAFELARGGKDEALKVALVFAENQS